MEWDLDLELELESDLGLKLELEVGLEMGSESEYEVGFDVFLKHDDLLDECSHEYAYNKSIFLRACHLCNVTHICRSTI